MKKRRVAISGLPLFCEQVAAQIRRLDPSWEPVMIQPHRRLRTFFQMASSSVWYSIGSPLGGRWVYWFSRLLRKPHVIHWVGSDIASAKMSPKVVSRVRSKSVRHLAEIEFTASELRAIGLPSKVVPLPPRFLPQAIPPLPKQFTVLLYVPRTRMEFYGKAEYERLIRRFSKEIRWIIVGGGTLDTPPGADVRDLGWRESLADVYADVTVLVRQTVSDGLALMVLEALAFARYVVWSKPFSFTRTSSNYEELEGQVAEMLQRHRAGALPLQLGAARFISERYGADACVGAIAATWREAL